MDGEETGLGLIGFQFEASLTQEGEVIRLLFHDKLSATQGLPAAPLWSRDEMGTPPCPPYAQLQGVSFQELSKWVSRGL